MIELENCDINRTFETNLYKDVNERQNENGLSKRDDAKLILFFYKNGDFWSIGQPGKEKNFKNLLGYNFIHYLLSKPNKHIDCLTLYNITMKLGIVTDGKDEKVFEYDSLEIKNTIDPEIDYNELATTRTEDLENAIKDFESKIEEDKTIGTNFEELNRKEELLKVLKKSLREKKGSNDNSFKKRTQENVQKDIKRVRDKIIDELAYMKTHLSNITTGYHCIYTAKVENEPEWVLYKNVRERRIKSI